MTYEQRQERQWRALEQKYSQFTRKRVTMHGPDTDELVASGKIITPYPGSICSRFFPLRSRHEEALAVMVPDLEDIEGWDLACPTPEQAIRYSSQPTPKDGHEGKNLVFPSEPPILSDIVQSAIPKWLMLAWRPDRGLSELCLYMNERSSWPENTVFIGFAIL